MLKQIPVAKEPKLQVHKYVVKVSHRRGKSTYSKFHYCLNLKEVREVMKKSKKGSWIETYLATHNFIQLFAHE